MSAAYLKRFKTVFLCSQPKGPKMSTTTANYLRKPKQSVQK